jgi:hypothetical protein
MSPSDIEVLLHFHRTAEDHPRMEAPAVKEAIRSFVANGLMTRTLDGYGLTQRGQAHVLQLCETPWPTAAWVGANGIAFCNNRIAGLLREHTLMSEGPPP